MDYQFVFGEHYTKVKDGDRVSGAANTNNSNNGNNNQNDSSPLIEQNTSIEDILASKMEKPVDMVEPNTEFDPLLWDESQLPDDPQLLKAMIGKLQTSCLAWRNRFNNHHYYEVNNLGDGDDWILKQNTLYKFTL